MLRPTLPRPTPKNSGTLLPNCGTLLPKNSGIVPPTGLLSSQLGRLDDAASYRARALATGAGYGTANQGISAGNQSSYAAANQATWGDSGQSSWGDSGGWGDSAQQDEGPTTMMIAADMIGVLIGKGGETVRFLSRESGARIEISKSSNGTDGDRMVTIQGSLAQVEKAKKMIEETLKATNEASGPNDPDATVVRVPKDAIGLLIGKGGEQMKRLRKESGARIDVAGDRETGGTSRLIYITGPVECVEYAKTLVDELVGQAGPDEDRPSSSGAPSTVVVHEVPEEQMGSLIGKGGAGIKELERSHKVKITSGKEDNQAFRALTIRGSPDDVERAKQAIEQRLRGMPGSGGKDDSHKQASEREPTRVVMVPPNFVGVLIGHRGEQVQELERDTGCTISIPKNQSTSGPQAVNLVGSTEACDAGAAAIEELMHNERPHGGSLLRNSVHRRPPHGASSAGRGDAQMVNEKIYVDELDLSYRPDLWHEFEDGLHSDIELFAKGLPEECAERDLWDHLCSIGARDVHEILMIKRRGKSKGMCYIVFQTHQSAVLARDKLHDLPAKELLISGRKAPSDLPEDMRLSAWFSESERCIKGHRSVYNQDIIKLLLGPKDENVQSLKEESGLKEVYISGAHMKSWGVVDNDPRLHMVAYYDPSGEEFVASAKRLWETQLENVHLQLAEQKTSGPPPAPALPPPGSWDQARAAEESPGRMAAEGDGDGAKGASCRGLDVTLFHADNGEESIDEVLTGTYEEHGDNHERPVFQKRQEPPAEGEQLPSEVFVYFWDARDGEGLAGWWFGASVGGEEVWARNACDDMEPPERGWELIAKGDTDLELVAASRMLERRKRRRRRHRHHGNEAGPPQPPPPWVLVPHEDSFYYSNEVTGESTWTPPPGCTPAGGSPPADDGPMGDFSTLGQDAQDGDEGKGADRDSRKHRKHHRRSGAERAAESEQPPHREGKRSRSRRRHHRGKDQPPLGPPGFPPWGGFPPGAPPGYPPHFMGPPHMPHMGPPHMGMMGYAPPPWEAWRGAPPGYMPPPGHNLGPAHPPRKASDSAPKPSSR